MKNDAAKTLNQPQLFGLAMQWRTVLLAERGQRKERFDEDF
jgi:hypothetical protein